MGGLFHDPSLGLQPKEKDLHNFAYGFKPTLEGLGAKNGEDYARFARDPLGGA